jgi:hypothetical protein
MIKTAFSLASAIFVVAIIPASADPYPDSFADYLNSRDLYFDYMSAAEESFWVKTSAGDIVLKLPRAVTPTISVVSVPGGASDADIATIRSEVESALSSALGHAGVRRCSTGAADDQASCIPLALQIGFSARHGDVIQPPELRAPSGRQLAGPASGYFKSDDRFYGLGCGTYAETSTTGELTRLDAAFGLEVFPQDAEASGKPWESLLDLGFSEEAITQQLPPPAYGIEKCILVLLGVSVVRDLPRDDLGYYVAHSIETLLKAETYLTHDQTAADVPQLIMTHALRKALGKEPVLRQ